MLVLTGPYHEITKNVWHKQFCAISWQVLVVSLSGSKISFLGNYLESIFRIGTNKAYKVIRLI